ncbi:hypothetical protein SAMN05444392_11661 [Seinonella peptonophila]|uniref:TcpE family protein n=1 Tax=Seinonella peptonophila TaxID=112248 RepID=A0A1M5AXL7_9BACL|nr:hypothetical protein [Seinonella peptonophila]SHF34965.1 hypothetical protein SAMN05444392_11661 [Seinonella peptonophila]
MQNLTRILERENKWYKVGPIVIARGIPKRIPFYFVLLLGIVYFISLLPFTPFWFFLQLKAGWVINYLIVPTWGALWMERFQNGRRSPERSVWIWIQFLLSNKRVNPYRSIDQPVWIRVVLDYTYRLKPRKEELHV